MGWDDDALIETSCTVCRRKLNTFDDDIADVVVRHIGHRHRARALHGRPFPADAVLTIGNGKTQYRLSGRGLWSRRIGLIACKSGVHKEAEVATLRWDGETFWYHSNFGHHVYRELPELKGTHQ
jgi:hypothetical protein